MEKQQISGRFIAGEKAFSWTVDVRRIARISRCDLSMRDQICRAAASVSANIAEGAGHHHPGDQARFYSIARGSLMETLMGLRLLVAEGQVDDATAAGLRDRGDEVGRILSGLIRSCHERRRAALPR
jgi:four helix bundle protein